MTTITASKAREKFSDLLSTVAFAGKTVRISRNRKVIAAMISASDLELFTRLLREAEDRMDAEDVRMAMEEADREGTVSLEDLKAELGI
jgi:PHD/YefM family antitoxin component YafN of YafNO toxin-antitoxin module